MRFKFYVADDIKEDYDQLPGSSELNFKADFLWNLPNAYVRVESLGLLFGWFFNGEEKWRRDHVWNSEQVKIKDLKVTGKCWSELTPQRPDSPSYTEPSRRLTCLLYTISTFFHLQFALFSSKSSIIMTVGFHFFLLLRNMPRGFVGSQRHRWRRKAVYLHHQFPGGIHHGYWRQSRRMDWCH